MTETEAIKLLKEIGALLEGHFVLSSGLHSGAYVQIATLMQYPQQAEKFCRGLADNMIQAGCPKPDVVIGPALGAITVGYELARQFGAKAYFAEREGDGFALRRGFRLNPGDKVIIAENTTTTGGSAQKVVALAQSLGADVLGVATLADRTAGKSVLTVPLYSLVKFSFNEYTKEDCPLCKQGLPIIKPGSSPGKAS